MPTYLSLMRWTKEGVEKLKESPSRLDAAKKVIEVDGVYSLAPVEAAAD